MQRCKSWFAFLLQKDDLDCNASGMRRSALVIQAEQARFAEQVSASIPAKEETYSAEV